MQVIGVTCNRTKDEDGFEFHGERYNLIRALEDAIASQDSDAICLLVPLSMNTEQLSRTLDICSGLVIPGGTDVEPHHYERNASPKMRRSDSVDDFVELWCAREALLRDIPLLGICRGLQVMAVASGASLIQDLLDELGTGRHDYIGREDSLSDAVHEIDIAPDSKLAGALEVTRVMVSSTHHQALDHRRTLPQGLKVTASDPVDGVAEAIEIDGLRFAVGVQFHPEYGYSRDPEGPYIGVFRAFVDAAASYHAMNIGSQ